jgi:hypothetical protein
LFLFKQALFSKVRMSINKEQFEKQISFWQNYNAAKYYHVYEPQRKVRIVANVTMDVAQDLCLKLDIKFRGVADFGYEYSHKTVFTGKEGTHYELYDVYITKMPESHTDYIRISGYIEGYIDGSAKC